MGNGTVMLLAICLNCVSMAMLMRGWMQGSTLNAFLFGGNLASAMFLSIDLASKQ